MIVTGSVVMVIPHIIVIHLSYSLFVFNIQSDIGHFPHIFFIIIILPTTTPHIISHNDLKVAHLLRHCKLDMEYFGSWLYFAGFSSLFDVLYEGDIMNIFFIRIKESGT